MVSIYDEEVNVPKIIKYVIIALIVLILIGGTLGTVVPCEQEKVRHERNMKDMDARF